VAMETSFSLIKLNSEKMS